ncbi:MAG: hypothetical protein QOC77_2166, partial [Thermoleophilaceae bacterium]|nr:hypothetical protein [Thermoleophilaceae bacterium]
GGGGGAAATGPDARARGAAVATCVAAHPTMAQPPFSLQQSAWCTAWHDGHTVTSPPSFRGNLQYGHGLPATWEEAVLGPGAGCPASVGSAEPQLAQNEAPAIACVPQVGQNRATVAPTSPR